MSSHEAWRAAAASRCCLSASHCSYLCGGNLCAVLLVGQCDNSEAGTSHGATLLAHSEDEQ